jgi:hypothetical protein
MTQIGAIFQYSNEGKNRMDFRSIQYGKAKGKLTGKIKF